MASPVILGLDIEATNLKPDFGTVLAVGTKALGKRAKILNLLDFYPPCGTCHRSKTDSDSLLLAEAHKVLSSADLWVGWYSKGFDLKFLNARMLIAGLDPLPPIPHIDLYFIAKHHFNLSSNRLAAWQEFLDLRVEKTPLKRAIWRAAGAGEPAALGYVATHCRRDTEVLEGVYMRLRSFVRTHPFVNGPANCRVCGSAQLERRGFALTVLKTPRQRVRCRNCGHWGLLAA